MFTQLEIEGWRQISSVSIEFHPRLTVLTGANGSGKTTILNILNQHFGWAVPFVATPVKKERGGPLRFLSDVWSRMTGSRADEQSQVRIGRMSYPDKPSADLVIDPSVSEQYQVKLLNAQPVPGVFVSSHRPIYLYERVDEIPTKISARAELLSLYVNDMRTRYQPRSATRSPTYHLKRALISLVTFGSGSSYMEGDRESIETFEGFQRVLQIVLPPSLGFRQFDIRPPEVVLLTESGDFSLDAVSGGVSAIIDIAWQIYLQDLLEPRFVVAIDEPENHLHPELQRRLLPSLLSAFPKAQFIIASHNPLIVSSVPDSNVYVLNFDSERRVQSFLLDLVNKAGSSNEILRDVLGLSNTLPVWVESRLEQITERFVSSEINEASLGEMRQELSQLGLAELLPDTLARVLEKRLD